MSLQALEMVVGNKCQTGSSKLGGHCAIVGSMRLIQSKSPLYIHKIWVNQ